MTNDLSLRYAHVIYSWSVSFSKISDLTPQCGYVKCQCFHDQISHRCVFMWSISKLSVFLRISNVVWLFVMISWNRKIKINEPYWCADRTIQRSMISLYNIPSWSWLLLLVIVLNCTWLTPVFFYVLKASSWLQGTATVTGHKASDASENID